MKPLAVELFAGKFGWGEGLVAEGWRVIGCDIVHEEWHEPVPEGCSLWLQDVVTLHGSQFRHAALLVASPPCQAYSYRAMPWKRAKALPPPSNELFDACFRIQREASEAAGHHIPMVVENVKGAQPWVGRAKGHYGSFYLWGDVPALMPITFTRKVPGFNFHQHEKTGQPGGSFQSAAVNGVKVPSESGRRTDPGKGARFTSRDCGAEGIKQKGLSGPAWFDAGAAAHSSRSSARKAASAQIAKIPLDLARHIARVFKPEGTQCG